MGQAVLVVMAFFMTLGALDKAPVLGPVAAPVLTPLF